MASRIWNIPLPEKFLLRGDQPSLFETQKHDQGWILRHPSAPSPVLDVELAQEIPGMNFRFFPRFTEPSHPEIESPKDDQVPLLLDFSWDWIEFKYEPINNLVVRSIYWSPEPGVICGESWINNCTDQERVVLLDMVCILQTRGGGNQIKLEKIKGRPVLTGRLGDQDIFLFLSGNPTFMEEPFPYLQNRHTLLPQSEEQIRWICIKSDSKQAGMDLLEKNLLLDSGGEISRRKIALQSQIDIKTGNPDWDFALSLSQKQAQSIIHMVISPEDSQLTIRGDLTPIRALMLFQSQAEQTSEMIKDILDSVFKSGKGEESSNHAHSPPILAAELLWQIHQTGYASDIRSDYLQKTAEWLEDWFSPGFDRDGDGIPELGHPSILNLAGSEPFAVTPSARPIIPYPYLESPGLSALIYNDLCKLDNLLELSGRNSEDVIQDRKETLLNFLQKSWNSEEREFLNRDSHSHQAVKEFKIVENLQSGLNILRTSFGQPARIGVLHHTPEDDQGPPEFSVICHGQDWLGNNRIEELHSVNFTWGGGIKWGFSEIVYAKLDYCILKENGLRGRISLIAPSTSSKDITQTLPLWAGAFPEDRTREIIKSVLFDSNQYWSSAGFSAKSDSGDSSMLLTWNLLLGQSLLRLGMVTLAAELIGGWMAAIIPVLKRSGSTFPGYDTKSGLGMGAENSLESLFPVKFFLDVLGIGFLQEKQLIITGTNPFPWPVTVSFKGYRIIRENKRTIISQPGKETITLTDPSIFQLDLP